MDKKLFSKVTVHDIAKEAGVSQSTVSKVLNNYSTISESTRDKVLKAINDLNFKPDPVARSLVTKKTNTIGLIIGDITNPFYSESSEVILKSAKEFGYVVIIYNTDDEKLETSVNNLIERRVDGIIIASVDRREVVPDELHEVGFPILFYNQVINKNNIHYIKLDDNLGAKMAVNYLCGLGHRQISFISGPINRSTYYNRYVGYKSALKQNGLNFEKKMVHIGDMDQCVIEHFIGKLLNSDNRPTSFFAASDVIALRIIAALLKFGLKVPEDISVVGFGDITFSSHPLINLTTVSQKVSEMSKIALKNIISIIENEEGIKPKPVILEPELVIRGTANKLY